MFRHVSLLYVLFVILGFTGHAWSQNFSDVVVFGDSLSDSGNIGQSLNLPEGSSFTTNPDPVAVEIVARTFGASGKHSLAGGSNYAWAGACMNPETPCDADAVPTVREQIDQYLSFHQTGADPDALYSLWGGLNDVADSLVNDPANAPLHTLAAAAVNVEQIKRLQEAGARHILVYNLPDIAVTPYAAAFSEPARVALSGLNAAYNERLEAGLRDREAGIIPINVWALTGELLETPETYGFTDVTGTACGEPNASSAVAVTCGPEGSGYPVTDKSDDTRRYLFADRSHPSGATHEIIANVVTSTLAAPVQVSLAGEGGVEIAAIHRSAVSNERMTDFRLDRGSWRGYVTGRIGTQKLNALPRLGDTRADVQVLTVGVNHRAGSEWWWGAAVSLGRYDNDASGASLDSTGVLGSLHGTWRRDGLYLSGALSVGKTSVDIKRSIALGSAVRAEQGSTDAGQFGTDLEFGWMLGNSQGLRHGPFLGLAWLDQTIDGYRENGNLSTSMNFSDFTRNSLIARGGYSVGGTMAWDSLTLRPYAGLAYEREFKDDPVSVTAGSNTMPGRFTLSGFMPPREWASTDFGLAVDVHENASAFAGYSGRFGSESRQDHRLNVGLRIAF